MSDTTGEIRKKILLAFLDPKIEKAINEYIEMIVGQSRIPTEAIAHGEHYLVFDDIDSEMDEEEAKRFIWGYHESPDYD